MTSELSPWGQMPEAQCLFSDALTKFRNGVISKTSKTDGVPSGADDRPLSGSNRVELRPGLDWEAGGQLGGGA
jgi:hypothetical protein